MTTITTKKDFDALLRAEQAVLFAFFDWSGQAHLSLIVFEQWQRKWRELHPKAAVSFYRLDLDQYKEAGSWFAGAARNDKEMDGGMGSVTWVRRGKSVGFVPYAGKAGPETLSLLTDHFFGSGSDA